MQWPDCLVDRQLTDQELIAALSSYLSVAPSTILVVAEVPAYKLPNATTMLCERCPVRGDFVLKLSFYPQDDAIGAQDGCRFIEFLCARTGCRCLVPDESENPFSMILVEGIDRRKGVFLRTDAMALDPEEYVIA
jgi:hypothetical protein